MKKIWSVFLILSLVIAFAACGGNQKTESQAPAPSETETAQESLQETGQETASNDAVIETIRSRGYLIAGCKMDVRGLSF